MLLFGGPFVLIFYFAFFTNVCARMNGKETYPLKSSATRFDPFAAIPEIRERVGKNAHLITIDARYVGSDGTMNLEANYKPQPNATYVFQVPLDNPPANSSPVGAGHGPGGVWMQTVTVECYQPGQRRTISTFSGSSRSQYFLINEGMEVDRSRPTQRDIEPDVAPSMSTAELWKIALEKGAPKDAVATITANRSGCTFSITGTKVNFYVDYSGKLQN